MIELGITQFVRVPGQCSLPKDARYGIGGGYEELPAGVLLEVVSGSTHDAGGGFREGSGRVLFTGTREEIELWNEAENGW